MRDRPDGPSFQPLSRTSAGLNEVLRVCFLRAAFQADPRFSEVRAISTASTLGRVSHRLLEEAVQGKFGSISETDLDQEVAHRWDSLVDLEERAMQERLSDSAPTHTRWPRYALRKATACRMASRIVRHRGPRPLGIAAAALEVSSAQAEVWYEGYQGKLAGRIDLIRRTGAGTELVDYKSGLVTVEDETLAVVNRVREPYERQVLIYAALVYENEGQWPVKATVESLIQGPYEVQVTPDKARTAVDEALDLLDSYNRQAAAGAVQGKPSHTACRWCDFKAICRDFLEAAEDSWEGPSSTVMGQVGIISPGAPSFFEFDVTGGNHPIGPVTVRGTPAGVALELSGLQGATLSFGGLRKTPGSNDLLFDWTAQSWRWASANKA